MIFYKQLQTWFILVVFSFCQIPAGLWHEHEFEVCVNPTHIHDEPEHACMVATLLPGNLTQSICGHSQHITTEKEHCKLCKFETAKYLESATLPFQKDIITLLAPKQIIYIASHQEFLLRAANKGPPVFGFC
ncbi:MAG: hypothetical protein SGJ10_06220 [Bacteroidota bacterium]|nr:hypothetical protein [Bacteroidota bacterium]